VVKLLVVTKTSSVSRRAGAPASGSPGGEPVSVGGIVAGKYRIGAVVGFSGMGIACAGVHLDLGTKVAVLFAHPEDASDERAVARFLQGARSAAQLRSQHARRVMDCGRLVAGEPYMVLESLEGADLRSIVTRHGSLPVDETLGFVLQACEALGEAHARGLVHGDVRPENLFLTRGPDGSALVKVLGLEFATELGGPRESRMLSESLDGVGPRRHLSPEQMSDATSVDTRADIWSLGVLLYELLTGVLPFEGDSASEVRDSVMSEHPRSPRDFDSAISKGLGEVVLRCLEKNPDTRFPDAGTLGGALRAFGGSTSSMGAARVADVLRYAGSIRPARDASPSIPAARRASSAPPLSRSSAVGHALAAPKLPAVPRAIPAAPLPVAPSAVAVSAVDSTESVRASWLMEPPGPGSAPASEEGDSEEEDSEEFVRPSWLMDEPAPATPGAIATTSTAVATQPPPIPASTPSAAVTPPRPTTPPPMPVASPSAPTTEALMPAGVRTMPSIPVVSPPATSKPPPMPSAPPRTTPPPMPAVTTIPPKLPAAPEAAATAPVPAAKLSGRITLPPLPPSVKEFAAVASAWVVKNQRPVIAAGGVGVFLVLMILLVLRAKPGPAAEPSAAPPTPAATSAVAPIRPVAPLAAPSAVEMAPSPVSAPPAVAQPRKPARAATPTPTPTPTASSHPKRPRQSLYPVLKPPNL